MKDPVVRLNYANTQNFSLLGPFLHLNFGGVILVVVVLLLVVTGGKQSQLQVLVLDFWTLTGV